MDIIKELKIYLILAVIVLIIFGLWLFISPESWAAANNWPFLDPIAGRIIGGIYIALIIIFLRLIREIENWEKIENWVLFSVMINILSVIAYIIGYIAYSLPILSGIIGVIIQIVFAIIGIHILIQKRK